MPYGALPVNNVVNRACTFRMGDRASIDTMTRNAERACKISMQNFR